ncbi:MAG: T9SS type A sorting domain-containing protein [Saprospiraceae bacterium]
MKNLKLFIILCLTSNFLFAQDSLTFKVLTFPCNMDGVVVIRDYDPINTKTIKYYYNGIERIKTILYATDTIYDFEGGVIYAEAQDAQSNYLGYGYFYLKAPFDFDVTTTPAVCPNLGTASITHLSGQAPFTYQWLDKLGQFVGTTNPISLATGTYNVIVKDANGCIYNTATNSDSIEIYQSSNIKFDVTTTKADCVNGTASINNITGGIAPYTFLWSNGATSSTLQNLITGYYSVTVTDAQGCSKEKYEIIIEQSKKIEVHTNILNSTCKNNDGTAIAFGSGGRSPYSYRWSNGLTTQTISNLKPDNYAIEVIDADGCRGSGYANVSSYSPVTANIKNVNASSCSAATGSAKLEILSGQAPFNILWNTFPVQSGLDLENVPAGNYSFTIKDANNCERTGTVNIPQEFILIPYFNVSTPYCDHSDGEIDINVTGGLAPYTYKWNTGSTSSKISNLKSGIYKVSISDAQGCKITKSLYMSPSSPLLLGFATTPASCLFTSDGSIQANVIGGNPPYQYHWSNGTNNSINNNLATGNYNLTVKDIDGCTVYNNTTVDYITTNDNCYCNIQGIVYHDVNGNCLQDPGEPGVPNIQMHCTDIGYTYTDANGFYNFKAPTGNYKIKETVKYIYPLASCQSNDIPVTVNAASGCIIYLNFANAIQPLHDIHLSTWSHDQAVPGFGYTQKLVVSNQGTIVEQNILANYTTDLQLGAPSFIPGGLFNQIGSSGLYESNAMNSLNPGESINFNIEFTVPTNVPINTETWFVDSCSYIAPLQNWLNDYSPWNNINLFKTKVVGSYDPNYIEVLPQGKGIEGIISNRDTTLEYMVHFQNVGNYYARKVEVEVFLDPNLDWKSLSPTYSSYPCKIRMSDAGKLVYEFDNIWLYPEIWNKELSQGFFSFTVRTKSNLAPGTKIQNHADIYFDFNKAVPTNLTLNTLEEISANRDNIESNFSFEVYPNPSSGLIFLPIDSRSSSTVSLFIYDLVGRIQHREEIELNEGRQILKFDQSNLSNGIYFIRLQNKEGYSETKRIELFKD